MLLNQQANVHVWIPLFLLQHCLTLTLVTLSSTLVEVGLIVV